MKKIKQFFVGLLVVMATINTAMAKNYPDVTKAHWAYPQINILSNEYVIVGYPDGLFKPDEPATRAEFATMVIKALHQENAPLTKTFEFSDVPYSYWAYNMIQRAIAFDLLKNTPDGKFRPEDNISKAEAVSIIVSALKTGNLSEAKAKQILSVYSDVNCIPKNVLVDAAKSELFSMTAHAPESGNRFEADRKITRAEVAVNLYNMREQAKLNPNDKLAEAMRLKTGEGYPIKGVKINGNIATIPAGTKIPVMLLNPLSSKVNEAGEVFIAKADKNVITTEKYLLIYQNSNVNGEIESVKLGKLFVRNGKIFLSTKNIVTPRGQCAPFDGTIDARQHQNWLVRIIRAVIKGSNVNLKEGDTVYVKLNKPVNIDLTNGWILE